jgi:hypothetical protein
MGGQLYELKGYSHRESTHGESWTTTLNLTELGQKAAHQKNTSLLKERATHSFSWVTLKKGVVDEDDDDDG